MKISLNRGAPTIYFQEFWEGEEYYGTGIFNTPRSSRLLGKIKIWIVHSEDFKTTIKSSLSLALIYG